MPLSQLYDFHHSGALIKRDFFSVALFTFATGFNFSGLQLHATIKEDIAIVNSHTNSLKDEKNVITYNSPSAVNKQQSL